MWNVDLIWEFNFEHYVIDESLSRILRVEKSHAINILFFPNLDFPKEESIEQGLCTNSDRQSSRGWEKGFGEDNTSRMISKVTIL